MHEGLFSTAESINAAHNYLLGRLPSINKYHICQMNLSKKETTKEKWSRFFKKLTRKK